MGRKWDSGLSIIDGGSWPCVIRRLVLLDELAVGDVGPISDHRTNERPYPIEGGGGGGFGASSSITQKGIKLAN